MNECNIVQDLLPLYADELASPDSVEFIRRHTAWCAECSGAWERISTRLPDVTPAEEVASYKRSLRRGKRKLFLKSLLLCLIALTIGAFFLYYQLYVYGIYPVSGSYPAPDGMIVLEVVEKEDAPIFYTGHGLMVRFNLKTEDGTTAGLNRHETTWDTLTAHWSPDSHHVVLDVVTNEGEHALFLTDAELERHNGGLMEIPGITEDLVPRFTSAVQERTSFETIVFAFDTWQEDCTTAAFTYITDSGLTGTIAFHYPTNSITSIR